MSLYCSKALVLKTRNLGEADRVLLLLSEEYGKFEAVVKGARRQRSRFIGNTLPFNLLNAMFFTGKNLDQLSQAELIHSFALLREDLIKLAYASFWVELIDEFVPERETVTDIYGFLLAALITLEKTTNPELLNLAFQMRLLNYLGYQPELDSCVSCGTQTLRDQYFSAKSGGIICGSCRGNYPDADKLEAFEIQFLQQLGNLDIRQLKLLEIPGIDLKNIRKLLRQFIEYRLDHPLKTQVFLDNVLS